MFLFTTPGPRSTAPANPVVDAIRQGARESGANFDYLLNTAQRESSLNPKAKASTSSATGLFQFIEQTWLGLVKSDGAKLGLKDYAGSISQRQDGTFAVADPAVKSEILALREDPKLAAGMAGVFTQKNRDVLAGEIGREPTSGDLYIAHFLGARGASDLIRAATVAPNRPAAENFPDAAAANRSIFFDSSGRARGAGEVYALLSANKGASEASAAPSFGPGKPLAFAKTDGPAFHGLFQTDARQGAVSDAVARLWRGRASSGADVRTAAIGGYFPRSGGGTAASPDPQAPSATGAPSKVVASEAARVVDAPLPPARPDGFASQPARRGGKAPLDLSSFMTWRKKT